MIKCIYQKLIISNITDRVQVLITVGDKHTYPSLLSIVVTNKAKRLACFIMNASVSPNQSALSACVKLWYTNTSEECLRSKSTISLLNPILTKKVIGKMISWRLLPVKTVYTTFTWIFS